MIEYVTSGISTTTQMNNLTIQPQHIFLEYPSEPLIQQGWFTALFSTIVGIIFITFVNIITEKIKNKNKRYKLAKNLYTEIIVFISTNDKSLPDMKNLIDTFIDKVEKNDHSINPMIEYTGKRFDLLYKHSLNDLSLLHESVAYKIYAFYQYVDSIDVNTRLLQQRFDKYYNGQSTVGPVDIKNLADKLYKQHGAAKILGTEVLVSLVEKYKIDKPLINEKNISDEKEIVDFFKNVNVDEPINILKLSEDKKISLFLITSVLLENKDFKNVSLGVYKKIK